ncbi:protein of unknown function DUF190 [Magnetococcus marinus MC-1]|uniref:Uncharacterized protein n=1 Tax=Magnetococcus marinus (strain ATCC BAA-1437 / JCM 17883 / MC-1) TaxID=156889 RepID=A0LDP0_MAGMM|nr:DUF190 domain-containing protein [Magnetococcus marinus]ABK46083.1 protein of unknown function DUF190 [Magnetococcus marinus MC-1]
MGASQHLALLRIYLNEDDHTGLGGPSLSGVLMERLKEAGVPGATLYRGVMGYGSHQQMHATSLLRLSEHLPLMLEAIHDESQLRQLALDLQPLLEGCLVLLQPVEIIHQPLNQD